MTKRSASTNQDSEKRRRSRQGRKRRLLALVTTLAVFVKHGANDFEQKTAHDILDLLFIRKLKLKTFRVQADSGTSCRAILKSLVDACMIEKYLPPVLVYCKQCRLGF